MSFNSIIADVIQYAQANPPGSIAAGVILLVLLFRRPKIFFILLLLCVAGIGVMHLFDTISSSGVTEKDFRALGELK